MQIFFFTSSIKKKIIIPDYLENNFLFILDLILFYAIYLIFGCYSCLSVRQLFRLYHHCILATKSHDCTLLYMNSDSNYLDMIMDKKNCRRKIVRSSSVRSEACRIEKNSYPWPYCIFM